MEEKTAPIIFGPKQKKGNKEIGAKNKGGYLILAAANIFGDGKNY